MSKTLRLKISKKSINSRPKNKDSNRYPTVTLILKKSIAFKAFKLILGESKTKKINRQLRNIKLCIKIRIIIKIINIKNTILSF